MNTLRELGIIDIRKRLPRPRTTRRYARRDSLTLHYNGGTVALHNSASATTEHWIEHLIGVASYHVGKVWGYVDKRKTIPIYGHGIMYHFAVLPSGVILQMRDLDEELWHCSNAEGNRTGLACHFPMGGNQAPTVAQWASFGTLALAAGADYGFGIGRIFGHTEWKKYAENAAGVLVEVPNSLCPGDVIMPMLREWRAQPSGIVVPAAPQMRFLTTLFKANVRTGPAITYPVVMEMPKGKTAGYDKQIRGEKVRGNNLWWHRGDGLGFVSATVLRV